MRHPSGAALAFAAILFAAPLAAQRNFIPKPPPKGRWEVSGLDISPNGGWRVKVRAIMERRRAMLAAGNIQGLNTPLPANVVSGTLNIPVLFVTFSGVAAPFATSSYTDVFFNASPATRPYSLRSFYQQLSLGNLDINGTLFNWVTASHDSSYYAGASTPGGTACSALFCSLGLQHLGQLLKEALVLDSAGVNWAQYDSDGDGVVDFAIFVQPLIGAECIGQASSHIWAHRYDLTDLTGSPFVTNTPWPGHPGQFIKVNDYTIQGGQGGLSACTNGQVMAVGTVNHETGHTFGLPDLYDTDANASVVTEGIGNWGLMGSGNYTVPESPSFYDAWSRLFMGWAIFDTLKTTQTRTLGPIETSDTVLYVPTTTASEFYLIENRQLLLSDSGMNNPGLGSQIRGPGLMVYHIDQNIVNSGLGSNTVNDFNANGGNEGVEVVQADGLNQLRTPGGGNRGDGGDPYPGTSNNHVLGYTTNPNLILHSGGLAGFKIDSITQVSANGPVSFRFIKSAPWVVTSNQVSLGALVTVNGTATVSYREVFGIGDSVHISFVDSQLVNASRTRLTWASWSNGQGTKSFVVAAPGTPDTVTATVNAAHKVKVTLNGLGTVAAQAGDTGAGAFHTAGTSDTLIATANNGQTFTNWTGDTSTSNATLVLPMHRPYNVTANFTGAVAVTVNQAVADLLGTPTLTTQQKNYLDLIGNNNAVYDLGDLLAYLKSQGIVASPALMARILSRQPAAPVKER